MSEYIVEGRNIIIPRQGKTPHWTEIVRCLDCKHATADQSDHDFREPLWCSFHRMDVRLDGFCAWGERKVVGE